MYIRKSIMKEEVCKHIRVMHSTYCEKRQSANSSFEACYLTARGRHSRNWLSHTLNSAESAAKFRRCQSSS